MGWKTIIEINHDHLKDAASEIADLLAALPHKSERELEEAYIYSRAIKVLGRRHSSTTLKLEIKA